MQTTKMYNFSMKQIENLKKILIQKDIPRYFNSMTIPGRANVAKATYGSLAALYLLHRLTRKPKADSCDSILSKLSKLKNAEMSVIDEPASKLKYVIRSASHVV